MQQLTFISSLEAIEMALLERKALVIAQDEDSDTDPIADGFDAVHSILKSFYKKDGKGYGDVEMNEKIIDAHLRYALLREEEVNGWISDSLKVNFDVIKFHLDQFSGRKYVMSDLGMKFSFTSKAFKENFSKIQESIA